MQAFIVVIIGLTMIILLTVFQRFWMLVRFWQLHFRRTMGRVAAIGELMMESRTLAWAYHSDCQDMLLDLCLSDGSSWPEMRTLGVGFWFTNIVSLRSRVSIFIIYCFTHVCIMFYIYITSLSGFHFNHLDYYNG
jgi:hypothetical protein